MYVHFHVSMDDFFIHSREGGYCAAYSRWQRRPSAATACRTKDACCPPTPGQRHNQLRQSPPAVHFSYKNRSKQFIPSYLTGALRRLLQQTGPIRPQAYVEKWISGISFSLQALYG
jgi:hypothetical protein